jgi:hypothetical protein
MKQVRRQRCADKCEYAVSKSCECQCGGKNHGKFFLKSSGVKNSARNTITIGKKIITPEKSLAVVNHSPDGFMWGYGGSGPAQLALAILLEYVPKEKAVALHQQFKWDVISKIDKQKPFELSEKEIRAWLKGK